MTGSSRLRRAEPSRLSRWVVLLCVGCAGGGGGPAPARSELVIGQELLERIAAQEGIGPEQALSRASEDALLARELERRDPYAARWAERVALARQLLEALFEEAKAGGPPTEAEVSAITEARFWELDRPRMVRVVHAVVLASAENQAARALAAEIAAATAGAKTAAEFEAAARAVPAAGLEVRVESLAPTTEDGRAVDPARPPPVGPGVQHFDRAFAAAAHQLDRPGEQSPVVLSKFGHHVIYLVSVVEPRQPDFDERRALLHDEIMSQRAAALSSAVLEQQRREVLPQQARAALSLMGSIGGNE